MDSTDILRDLRSIKLRGSHRELVNAARKQFESTGRLDPVLYAKVMRLKVLYKAQFEELYLSRERAKRTNAFRAAGLKRGGSSGPCEPGVDLGF